MSTRLFRLLHGSQMKAFDGLPGPTPTFPFGTGLDFMGKMAWEVCAATPANTAASRSSGSAAGPPWC